MHKIRGIELIGWLWVLQSLSKTFSNLRHFEIDGSHPHCSQFGIVFLGYCCYFWKKACNEVNENNQNNHYRFSDQRQAMKTANSVVKIKVSTWKINLQTACVFSKLWGMRPSVRDCSGSFLQGESQNMITIFRLIVEDFENELDDEI